MNLLGAMQNLASVDTLRAQIPTGRARERGLGEESERAREPRRERGRARTRERARVSEGERDRDKCPGLGHHIGWTLLVRKESYRGTSLIRNTPLRPYSSLCLGPYGGPRGVAFSHERGTPLGMALLSGLGRRWSHCQRQAMGPVQGLLEIEDTPYSRVVLGA